jgi:hypothetical protein
MKNRAAKWKAMANPGFGPTSPIIGTLPTMKMASLGTAIKAPDEIMGIPVIRDPEAAQCAEARGMLVHYILVNDRFLELNARTRHAVLLHEAQHCIGHHFVYRMLITPLVMIAGFFLLIPSLVASWQEKAADRLAVREGYGAELKAFLARVRDPQPIFYPTPGERIAAIDKFMQKGDSQ